MRFPQWMMHNLADILSVCTREPLEGNPAPFYGFQFHVVNTHLPPPPPPRSFCQVPGIADIQIELPIQKCCHP